MFSVSTIYPYRGDHLHPLQSLYLPQLTGDKGHTRPVGWFPAPAFLADIPNTAQPRVRRLILYRAFGELVFDNSKYDLSFHPNGVIWHIPTE